METEKHTFAMKVTGRKLLFSKMQKRGLSEVVATLGIVLLTFAAAGIIIGFLVPYFKDNLAKSTECTDFREYFSFETERGYNCLNSTYRGYWMSVRAGTIDNKTAQNLKGLKISFVKQDKTTEVIDIIDRQMTNNVKMLNDSTTLYLPKSGEVKTYKYATLSSFVRAEVYPLLNSGRLCEEGSSIDLENEIC